MALSSEDVARIAHLARIEITTAESVDVRAKLDGIFDLIGRPLYLPGGNQHTGYSHEDPDWLISRTSATRAAQGTTARTGGKVICYGGSPRRVRASEKNKKDS